MKVFCTAQKRMDDVYPYMKKHAALFGKNVEIAGELFDDPSYQPLTGYFMTVENNGPDGQLVPDYLNNYSDYDVALTLFEPFGKAAFDRMPGLRMVGSIRGGAQHIDVKEATKRGIAAFSVPGRNAHSVSDYTIAMILAECRELARNYHVIMNGGWLDPSEKNHFQPELYEKTVGIVGLGAIGRLVAQKLIGGWNMRVLAYDPFVSQEAAEKMGVELTDLKTLFRESDFVTLHAKVTEENRHMVGKELLESMKPTAFFINTARAALVDTAALYEVLKEKKIAGAALDVMDREPVDPEDPFLKLDNVTITGHLAGNSSDTLANSPKLLVREMLAVIKGEGKVGLLNPEVLENIEFREWLEKVRKELEV